MFPVTLRWQFPAIVQKNLLHLLVGNAGPKYSTEYTKKKKCWYTILIHFWSFAYRSIIFIALLDDCVCLGLRTVNNLIKAMHTEICINKQTYIIFDNYLDKTSSPLHNALQYIVRKIMSVLVKLISEFRELIRAIGKCLKAKQYTELPLITQLVRFVYLRILTNPEIFK